MKIKLYILTFVVGMTMCAAPEDPSTYPEAAQWTANPNGDSELALLMRDMYDDGIRVKHDILKGRKPDIKVDLSGLYTQNATEPEKGASAGYQAMGQAYEEAVRQLESAPKRERPHYYQSVVNACMACHQTHCPGPRSRIRKMFYSKKQMAAF